MAQTRSGENSSFVNQFSQVQQNRQWAQFVPYWNRLQVLVLEETTGLSAALNLQARGSVPVIESPATNSPMRSKTSDTRSGRGTPVAESMDGIPACRKVLTFSTVRSAVDLLRVVDAVDAHAIIMDFMSREADSLAVIRQLSRSGIRIPMIAVASPSQTEITPLLLEAGCSALLTKMPFEQEIMAFVKRLDVFQ